MKNQKTKIIMIALILALLCGCGQGGIADQPGKTENLSIGDSSETVAETVTETETEKEKEAETEKEKGTGTIAETKTETKTETGTDNTNTGSIPTPGKEKELEKSNDEHAVISTPDAGESGQVFYEAEPEALLKLVRKSGEEIIICDNMPSPPSISPDGKMIAYLSPYEWEVLSDVFIYHLDKNRNENVLNGEKLAANKNIREHFTPKKAVWLDNRHLLVIIQYAYGTVAQGGDLFVYDTMEDNLRLLIKTDQDEQVTDMRVEDGTLYLDVIYFMDESMREYQEMELFIEAGRIYEAMRYKNILYDYDLHFGAAREDALNTDEKLNNYPFYEDQPYEEISADLDGDGKYDTVKYQRVGESDYIFVLKVNDKEITGFGDNLDVKPYLVDIDENDGLKEIAIQEFGPSNDEKTHFYCYTGGEIKYMGSVDGLCTEKGRITGNGRVIARIRPPILQTWFVRKEYKLDNNHLLEGIESELYPADHEAEPLILKTNLTLYDKPKSKNAASVLKPGDTLKLLGCDGIEWCLGQTGSGSTGWFAVDGFTVRENNLYVEDVFEGLCFAD
ncbi:MAG: DUF4652 domain-containing protein [Acetivibrionales bacterium]